MSWLVEGAQTRDDLFAMHPALAADHHRLLDVIWQGSVDPRILEYCRLRTATLLGNTVAWQEPRSEAAVAAGLDATIIANLSSWPSHPDFDDAARGCLALAEQYVIDVHSITDTQVTQLAGLIGADGVVTLTTALAAWEITHRFDNALLTPARLADAQLDGDN